MSVDLQHLFDEAGRNPPAGALDADTLLPRMKAHRSRERRITGAVAASVAAIVAVGLGVTSQHLLSATPEPRPAAPAPSTPVIGTLARLAYALDGDIYVSDGDGSNPVKVADGPPPEDGTCGDYKAEGPMWSPDGEYLAYRGGSTGGDTSPTAVCKKNVNISDAAGHLVGSFTAEAGWAIAWSPDSTRVATWLDFYPGTRIGIYGIDGVRQALLAVPPGLMSEGDFDPVWSADGASLLLPPGLVIPVDGSTPWQLPAGDPRSQYLVIYSPDGTQVAYIAQSATAASLIVAGADGSHARVLIPYLVENAAWSPTGDRIAFASSKDGHLWEPTELDVVDVASGIVTSLVRDSPDYLTAKEFSPEGDLVLYGTSTTHGKDYPSLWSVPADGSSDPRLLVPGTFGGDWAPLSPSG